MIYVITFQLYILNISLLLRKLKIKKEIQQFHTGILYVLLYLFVILYNKYQY